MGGHTDYNEGFVLAAAVDCAAWIALRPRNDGRVSVYSVNYQQWGEFPLAALRNTGQGWLEYLKGVAASMMEAGFQLSGWEGVLVGDVPIGAGLSSSAALEMATVRAFVEVSNLPWERRGWPYWDRKPRTPGSA